MSVQIFPEKTRPYLTAVLLACAISLLVVPATSLAQTGVRIGDCWTDHDGTNYCGGEDPKAKKAIELNNEGVDLHGRGDFVAAENKYREALVLGHQTDLITRNIAVLDGSASFVAEDQGWGAALVVAAIGMHVGSADAGRFDLDHRFAIGGRQANGRDIIRHTV